ATSAPSAQVTATPVSSMVPPPQVGNLIAMEGSEEVDLSWDAIGSAAEYTVYYSTTLGFALGTAATQTSATSSATVTGLTNNTAYYFRVSATNAFGEGPASAEV